MNRRTSFIRSDRGDASPATIIAFIGGAIVVAAILSGIACIYWPAVTR